QNVRIFQIKRVLLQVFLLLLSKNANIRIAYFIVIQNGVRNFANGFQHFTHLLDVGIETGRRLLRIPFAPAFFQFRYWLFLLFGHVPFVTRRYRVMNSYASTPGVFVTSCGEPDPNPSTALYAVTLHPDKTMRANRRLPGPPPVENVTDSDSHQPPFGAV